MELYNCTRDRILLGGLKTAESPWQKLKGLLGTKELSEDSGLWIKQCRSVHTFGMHYDLGLIFLDSRGFVVRVVDRLPRNRISPWVNQAESVIEVKAGFPKKARIRVHDRLMALPAAESL